MDRERPTQFGRAMRQLGVEMIPAYSPEARGRCERMFATHQERLPKELAARGIKTIPGANRYPACVTDFRIRGTFVVIDADLVDIPEGSAAIAAAGRDFEGVKGDMSCF